MIADKNKIDAYYQALLNRDSSYVGAFFVGVKTTSVFCIATCRARKPKKENVEFYPSYREALAAGFRPCKVCKPTENANEAPDQVRRAIELVRQNPKNKISDVYLKSHDISPSLLRRWFKSNYGMTFQSFQRMYRINVAVEEIKSGKTSLDAAYAAGYESLSGFGYTVKKVVGASPRDSRETNVILIDRFTTPLGPMFVGATNEGVCLLEFVDRRMLETEFRDLQRQLKATIIAGENTHIKVAKKEMTDYFSGKQKTFSVKLDMPGTPFQKLVWQGLIEIPYGSTSTYQRQAQAVGKSTAVRAVASANGHNRVAIIVPCHRVIGKNGKLVGYGGGLERKRWLLDHEMMNNVSQ